MRHIGDWLDKNFAIVAFVLACIFIMCSLVGCGDAVRIAPPKSLFRFNGGTDGIDAMMIWLLAISILGIGASIALSSFVGKQIAGAGVAGFGAILVSSLLVKAAIPFLPWVSLGLILIGGSFLIWWGRREFLKRAAQEKATEAAVAYGCDVAGAVTTEDVTTLKTQHALKQIEAGVKPLIDKALDKVIGNK